MRCFGSTIRQNKLHSRESNAEAKILPRHFIFIRLYMLKIVVISCAQVLTRVVHRYTYRVKDGRLVEEDWELRDGQYHIAAKDLLHENISSGISILELEEPFFRILFPGGRATGFPIGRFLIAVL